MDVNGNTAIKGQVNDPEITDVEESTNSGQDIKHTKGVLRFTNGLKIQWDSINVQGNGGTAFVLPEPYTEAHYNVIGCYADNTGDTSQQSSLSFWVPGTNTLSECKGRNAHADTQTVTYISVGKDVV